MLSIYDMTVEGKRLVNCFVYRFLNFNLAQMRANSCEMRRQRLMIIMIVMIMAFSFLHQKNKKKTKAKQGAEKLSIMPSSSTHNRYIISISTQDQLPFATERKLSTTHYNQQSTTRFSFCLCHPFSSPRHCLG